MSKNLIINKLNKCKAYQFNQNNKPFEESTSKISTSTKTQQSPVPYNLNPQFTFKATELKQIFLPKPKAQIFFQNFDANNDVIYQKTVLIRPKMLQRSLQFQLINLFRQHENNQRDLLGRRLQFVQKQYPSVNKIELSQSIQVRESNYRIPQFIKTQYTEANYHQSKVQNQYKDYYQNNHYDSKKYKFTRQKVLSRQKINYDIQKRCQTQVDLYHQQNYQQLASTNYQNQHSQKQFQFDDYHFVSQDIKQTKKQNVFNDYYIHGNINSMNSLKLQNPKSIEKKGQYHGIHPLSKRQGNSSRLSFFRKQREHHFRKSLLQQFNNNSKRSNICSNDNKQNIRTNSRFVPSLVLNNLSQAAQKKLKNQYSERCLLNKKQFEQNQHLNKVVIQPKGSFTHINKETQTRIQSIRKQLKQIYQVKNKQRSKLKIMRDQQTYDNNMKNSLRRVGSICKF